MLTDEQICHEIMVTVTVPASVDDVALCAAIQREYDEGDIPNGGFILKDRAVENGSRKVSIYFAIILDDYLIEKEVELLKSGIDAAMCELDGCYRIDSVGPEKGFSEIESY